MLVYTVVLVVDGRDCEGCDDEDCHDMVVTRIAKVVLMVVFSVAWDWW